VNRCGQTENNELSDCRAGMRTGNINKYITMFCYYLSLLSSLEGLGQRTTATKSAVGV